jgi:hypothetical protein
MTTTDPAADTVRIRELNDTFRRTFAGGTVYVTAGVNALETQLKVALFMAVQNFTGFTKDNDPYEEHDFGTIELGPRRFMWKIDYYAPDMERGSEDFADPETTVRVLTVMLAEEY